MKVTLESTTKTVELKVNGHTVLARLWQGETASGVPVVAYITRIMVESRHDQEAFQRELQECAAPRPEVEAIPMRLIL